MQIKMSTKTTVTTGTTTAMTVRVLLSPGKVNLNRHSDIQ